MSSIQIIHLIFGVICLLLACLAFKNKDTPWALGLFILAIIDFLSAFGVV